jgi:hypothetical protein
VVCAVLKPTRARPGCASGDRTRYHHKMSNRPDFQPVGHSGGQVTIRVATDGQGRRGYQLTWQHCRPVAAAMFGVYALPQGIVLCQAELGGIGSPMKFPAIPGGCYPVFIGSDNEGLFGRHCPGCNGYWRGQVRTTQFSPYCGLRAGLVDFLTPGQVSYVAQFCAKITEALNSDTDGEYIVDMDLVADAVGKDAEKPAFYYAEESQQNKFTCNACGTFHDILGRFGYCSVCGTRNDLHELADKTIPALRSRIDSGGPYEACVKDAVSEFDSFAGVCVAQLLQHVAMTPSRRNRLEKRRFHNLQSVAADLREILDIDILDGMAPDDIQFGTLMFHRRHVYEHKGGEADEKYIADSGDNSVRVKQALHETVASAHRITSLVLKMATNLHHGFQEIFPPDEEPIKQHRRRIART